MVPFQCESGYLMGAPSNVIDITSVRIDVCPQRNLRPGASMVLLSLVLMHVSGRAKAHEQYCSGGMAAVNRAEKAGRVIERRLAAEGGGQSTDELKLVVVAQGVGLDAGEKAFVEARRFGRDSEQQFVGAVHVFNPPPEAFAIGKVQGGLGQVAVEVLDGGQDVIASPDERA